MKTSTILTRARGLIRNGDEKFICLSVEDLRWRVSLSYDDYCHVKNIICTRMQMPEFFKWLRKQRSQAKQSSLEWWLVWKGHVSASNMPSAAQMREYRVAWLTALIAEFKSKGD